MGEHITVVTRKGQITLPADIRRLLGVKVGDKMVVSLTASEGGQALQVTLKPVRSVAEMTFGAVPPRAQPVDLDRMRRMFEDEVAENFLGGMEHINGDPQE